MTVLLVGWVLSAVVLGLVVGAVVRAADGWAAGPDWSVPTLAGADRGQVPTPHRGHPS
ncbi:hypothetical protein [Modestobacter sp. Leaf380]|uniref:hypothetical protein n=1 Tax=Modestobacter sp. Leaf380 TaxID=1736356 RepID=UPI0012F8B5DC|nr:hypothetical protein [Modestobacter sp. Leaf380]